MTSLDIVFILVAVVTGGAAVMTVTSRNLVHAALFLGVTLAGIGATFLLLAADFVAMVQVVVYLGAITVLFLFGLMLTRAPIGRETLDSRNRPMAMVVSAALFGILVVLIVRAFGSNQFPATEPISSSVADLGMAIFSTWVFPFEVVSMMLLAALVGAVLLARRQSGDSGTETRVTPIREALDDSTEELDRAPAELGSGGER
ncbi:NADH-quinone oxidoreductase subunit J [Salsipaludibacter albus]|uniref:NADH-quinone oxidoreductase subunit J family protein n=1 Tax=Salsipaludibacter albus TaxID=2849650 RepID=UPI001EE3F597|nr:NADH-quinone oxidoreductase subunit J [Salsipaludibacter albus]MBY5161027.1 NADH-quinone oxidoreductase subunit J [Salsipaludibacter albus]